MQRLTLTALWAGALLLAACSPAPVRPEPPARSMLSAALVNATVWQQSAAEYEALTRQTFQLATARLDALLADTASTAALEQHPPYASLPPTVVVDLDETMIDNAAYEARVVHTGKPFHQDDWNAWVQEAAAREIPGARDFAMACAARGIAVIYLSNRKQSELEATMANLVRLEFPYADDPAYYALRPDDRADPQSSKSARRQTVAQRFRILMLVGDNLGDFTPAFEGDRAARLQAVRENQHRLGSQWFVLPNAMYGSWEDVLYRDEAEADDARRHQLKVEALDVHGLGPRRHDAH